MNKRNLCNTCYLLVMNWYAYILTDKLVRTSTDMAQHDLLLSIQVVHMFTMTTISQFPLSISIVSYNLFLFCGALPSKNIVSLSCFIISGFGEGEILNMLGHQGYPLVNARWKTFVYPSLVALSKIIIVKKRLLHTIGRKATIGLFSSVQRRLNVFAPEEDDLSVG